MIRLVQQLPSEGDVFVWDDVVPGFGVRCRHGQKSYIVQYRVLGGRGARQRRVTLGRVGALSLEDARHLAQEYLRGVRYGQDPAGDRQARRQMPTVADLAERYLREHADLKKKPRSAHMDHYKAASDHLHVYCMEHNAPFRRIDVGGKRWSQEYAFHINVYSEAFSKWLKRQNGQGTIHIVGE